MRRLTISLVTGSFLGAAAFCGLPAQADPLDVLGGIAEGVAGSPFVWGGHNYCWYPGGWHGPGWYWCGYDEREGYGWGGGEGWHGWHHGGHGGHHGGDHHDGDHHHDHH